MDPRSITRTVARAFRILGVLALPADAQVACLERMGVAPLADELALELGDQTRLLASLDAGEYLDEADVLGLQRLDALLNRMSGQENAHLWTFEALASRPEWERVRQQAREFLFRL